MFGFAIVFDGCFVFRVAILRAWFGGLVCLIAFVCFGGLVVFVNCWVSGYCCFNIILLGLLVDLYLECFGCFGVVC